MNQTDGGDLDVGNFCPSTNAFPSNRDLGELDRGEMIEVEDPGRKSQG